MPRLAVATASQCRAAAAPAAAPAAPALSASAAGGRVLGLGPDSMFMPPGRASRQTVLRPAATDLNFRVSERAHQRSSAESGGKYPWSGTGPGPRE